jgi:hypothetical protein
MPVQVACPSRPLGECVIHRAGESRGVGCCCRGCRRFTVHLCTRRLAGVCNLLSLQPCHIPDTRTLPARPASTSGWGAMSSSSSLPWGGGTAQADGGGGASWNVDATGSESLVCGVVQTTRGRVVQTTRKRRQTTRKRSRIPRWRRSRSRSHLSDYQT